MSQLLYPTTVNAVSKQLNANYTTADAVITLTNTTNVQNKPGVCLINRVDTNGTLQPTANWTYIEFTATSGATLTGCTAISGDQDQALGKVVEFVSDVTQQQRILDTLVVGHNDDGTHKASLTFTTPTLTSPVLNTGVSGTAVLDEDTLVSDSATALATQQSIKAYVDGGWSTYSAVTPTSGTLDDPSFPIVFAGVDLTTILYVGMRVKITQATVKYFIITAVAFSTDTTVTLYGGTDYDLVATGTTAITAFAYSAQKTPTGFPITPAKWAVSATDTSSRSQANPGTGWLNLGSVTISIPIGVWDVNYFVRAGWQSSGATTDFSIYSTLSTANNSESSSSWTSIYGGRRASVTGFIFVPLSKSGLLTTTSKTSYYLNTKTADAGAGITIYNANDSVPLLINAVCAYL